MRYRKKQTRKSLLKIALLKIILLVAVVAGAYIFGILAPWASNSDVGSMNPGEIQGIEESVSGSTIPIHVAEIEDTRFLELINHNHAIKQEPNPENMVLAWSTIPVSLSEIMLHERALEAISKMFDSARKNNMEGFFVSSGYRNLAQQAHLYDQIHDKSLVMPPGHSEHHSGLAVDILIHGISKFEMGSTQEGQWLAENSWRYGLILRYTEEKRHITGIADEPWHYRYVGRPHAYFMWSNNLSFEEYIEFLRESGGHVITLDGNQYTILYQIPRDGIIYVPESLDFEISGDNTGGYIVIVQGTSPN